MEDVKEALENLSTIPENSLAVSRAGPDLRRCYNWTIEFLVDSNNTHVGDIPLFETITTSLTGLHSRIEVTEVVKGTKKEVQQISILKSESTASVHENTTIALRFKGEETVPITITPNRTSNTCNTAITEVQRITSSTIDTKSVRSEGTSKVSGFSQLRLSHYSVIHGTEMTSWISLNPFTSPGDCTIVASVIESELESFDAFGQLTVTATSTGVSEGCYWDIQFYSAIGNVTTFSFSQSET